MHVRPGGSSEGLIRCRHRARAPEPTALEPRQPHRPVHVSAVHSSSDRGGGGAAAASPSSSLLARSSPLTLYAAPIGSPVRGCTFCTVPSSMKTRLSAGATKYFHPTSRRRSRFTAMRVDGQTKKDVRALKKNMAAGAPVENPFELREGTAQDTGCGPGDSFCRRALNTDYETRMRSDPCSIQTNASDDEKTSNYYLWLPGYRKKPCESSGYQHCSTDTSRFGPRKVTQESFLQGRGQVTGPRGCFASGLRFLPKDEFDSAPKTACHDMTLFPQNTQVKKSCGSVSEVDVDRRLRPLPGVFAGAFVPYIMSNESLVPNVTDRYGATADDGRGGRGRVGVTLSTKKYPSWKEIKEKQDSFR